MSAEALRLYPPAWATSRRALDACKVGEVALSVNTTVLISQFVVHHDPRYYPDPFHFDPQRWTPQAQAIRPRHAYIPFGTGPRRCIGESFAWMEGVLLLATLAQQWRMRLLPGHTVALQPATSLQPKYGMPMILSRR